MKLIRLCAVLMLTFMLALSSCAGATELNLGALDSLLTSLKEEAPKEGKASLLAALTGGTENLQIGVIVDALPATNLDAAGVPNGFDTRLVGAVLEKANYSNYTFVAVAEADVENAFLTNEISFVIGLKELPEGWLASDTYLSGEKNATLTTGETVVIDGMACRLMGNETAATVIGAFDKALEKIDIAGDKDKLYAEYFKTGALFKPVSAVRRWAKGIWRQFRINLIDEARYRMIFTGLGRTLTIALCAALIGVVLGCAIALMRLSNLRIGKWYALRWISTLYVDIIRGTPVVVQLMIMYYIILNSPNVSKIVVAVLSFGLNSAAYVSEMVRGGILAVDKGQTEAGRSLGLSSGATLILIVLPQTIKIIIPSVFNEIIMLLKETSVVGFIGLMDLTKAGDYIRSRTYSAFFPLLTVAGVYLIIVTALTRIFNRVERRMRQSDIR